MARFLLVFALAFIFANTFVWAEEAENSEECGFNEEINSCGRMCEPSCGCRHRNPIFCPGIQCGGLTSGCRCKEGFVRNEEAECVLPEDCPVKEKDNSGPVITGLKFCLDED